MLKQRTQPRSVSGFRNVDSHRVGGKHHGGDKKTAEAAVNALFSLDLDLKLFYETVKNDEIMADITRKLWGLKSPTTPTVFEALVDSIVRRLTPWRPAA